MRKLFLLFVLIAAAVGCEKNEMSISEDIASLEELGDVKILDSSIAALYDEDLLFPVDDEIEEVGAESEGYQVDDASKTSIRGVTLKFRSQSQGRTRYNALNGTWIGADEFRHLGIGPGDQLLAKRENRWMNIGWSGGLRYNYYSFLNRITPGTEFFVHINDLDYFVDLIQGKPELIYKTIGGQDVLHTKFRMYNATSATLENLTPEVHIKNKTKNVWLQATSAPVTIGVPHTDVEILLGTTDGFYEVGDELVIYTRSNYPKNGARAAILPSVKKLEIPAPPARGSIEGFRFENGNAIVNFETNVDAFIAIININSNGGRSLEERLEVSATQTELVVPFSPTVGETYQVLLSSDRYLQANILDESEPVFVSAYSNLQFDKATGIFTFDQAAGSDTSRVTIKNPSMVAVSNRLLSSDDDASSAPSVSVRISPDNYAVGTWTLEVEGRDGTMSSLTYEITNNEPDSFFDVNITDISVDGNIVTANFTSNTYVAARIYYKNENDQWLQLLHYGLPVGATTIDFDLTYGVKPDGQIVDARPSVTLANGSELRVELLKSTSGTGWLALAREDYTVTLSDLVETVSYDNRTRTLTLNFINPTTEAYTLVTDRVGSSAPITIPVGSTSITTHPLNASSGSTVNVTINEVVSGDAADAFTYMITEDAATMVTYTALGRTNATFVRPIDVSGDISNWAVGGVLEFPNGDRRTIATIFNGLVIWSGGLAINDGDQIWYTPPSN